MKYLLLSLLLCNTAISMAQSDEGFWDNVRNTNETIVLNAGKRKVIKTADFPVGTTEVVYRISILDDNQKLSSSLVSVLKAIPDPTGISQGAAGTVFLLSAISGDDKCKFFVFTNENEALQYEKTGVAKNACVAQEEPVSKAAKLLSEKSKCMPTGAQNIWFGFESDNWVMKEKIILEVVPWVDYNLRKGWTVETKKELLAIAEKLQITKKVANKDLFIGNFIEALTVKYSYANFKKLLAAERAKAIDDLAEACLAKSGQMTSYLDAVREDINILNFTQKQDEAIVKLQTEIIDRDRATAADYGLLGNLYLATKQFTKAEEAYQKAIVMNKSELNYQLHLAHVYMFTNRLGEAKEIHKKYKQNNLSNSKSWTEQTKFDFQQFEKNGFDSRNFKKILRILD